MSYHQHDSKRKIAKFSRRRFLGAATLVSIVPRHVLGGQGHTPPSEMLNVAGVGLGAIGAENLQACEGEKIVALCDVDWVQARATFQRYPKAVRYKDYRRMLDKQRDIDAVIVATPDHTHAVISAAVMNHGKGVYTQMPLAHDVWEARRLAEIARETGVTTQMGNERFSGPTIRSVCEWIWAGCIGPIREVHCWTNRPQWPQGMNRPKGRPAVPSDFDWDLWLGPAPERPYHGDYHPYYWRGWRDFGTGALGAMGCHVMDGAFWALKLADAATFTVEADSVGGTEESYPRSSAIRYRFPARSEMPPVTLVWNDGGRRPPRPDEFPMTREFLGSNGTLFIGEKGMLTFGALTAGTGPGSAGPRFIPESLHRSFDPPKPSIPRIKSKDRWFGRHVQEWVAACKGGAPPCSRFEISGPFAEMVLLGNVALRCGEPVEWNRRTMKIAGSAATNQYLRRQYRSGWSL